MAKDKNIVNVTRLPNNSLLIHCGEKADSSCTLSWTTKNKYDHVSVQRNTTYTLALEETNTIYFFEIFLFSNLMHIQWTFHFEGEFYNNYNSYNEYERQIMNITRIYIANTH